MEKVQEITATVVAEDEPLSLPMKKFEVVRHPNFVNEEDDEFIKNIKSELDCERKLELDDVSVGTSMRALSRDIDKMTNSKDYVEVTRRSLEKLFRIRWINLNYCMIYNFIQMLTGIKNILFYDTEHKITFWGTIALLPPAAWCLVHTPWSNSITTLQFLAIVGTIVLAAATVVLFVFWIILVCNVGSGEISANITHYTHAHVNLKVKPLKGLSRQEIEIPHGAKLRAVEALESGMFQKIVIAYPKLNIDERQIVVRGKQIDWDPAICGVAADKRMFMIVSWDIQNDIDKTIESTKRLRHLKLKQ